MPVYERRGAMPVSADELFAYHARPGAFQRLAPPWQKMRVLDEAGDVMDGQITFEVWFGPVKRRWTAEMHGDAAAGQFVDRQVSGPFARWEHTHRCLPGTVASSSELIDHVEFALPAGGLTGFAGDGPALKTAERLFRFRHARTRLDLERHARWAAEPRLTVAIAGAGGLIGSNLASYLTTAGHRVIRLVRRHAAGAGEVSWDPAAGRLDPAALAGVDAVVNLAGATIASRWSTSRRAEILGSRVAATRTLVAAMAAMDKPPAVFVSASAVGAYGLRGAEEVTEQVGFGGGFLADVCRQWEAASAPAADAGIRVVNPRFGIVVSAAGGAVAKMLPAFKAGLGARLGAGYQYWAWVELDDALAALEWMLHDAGLSGPVNVTSPQPVTNRELTKTIGHVLHRPAVLSAPGIALKHGLGGMGEEMLLAGQRAVPARLHERDFRFAFPGLEAALRYELGRG